MSFGLLALDTQLEEDCFYQKWIIFVRAALFSIFSFKLDIPPRAKKRNVSADITDY